MLSARGVEALVVGGAVRDMLLGRTQRDFDLLINVDPEEIGASLAASTGSTSVVIDAERRYVRLIVPPSAAAEVRWIDLAGLAGSIEADLARRDFTVNAIAVRLTHWVAGRVHDSLIDPLDGAADLVRRVVKQAGPRSIIEDPLRSMRACRFAAQLGFTIDDATARSVRGHRQLLAGVAPERIREEMFSTIGGENAVDGLRLLDTYGILDLLLPELCEGKGVEQPREHYWDVFEHALQSMGQAERILSRPARLADPVLARIPWIDGHDDYFGEVAGDDQTRAALLKLAALLHDVAKPRTKTFEPGGRMRFFGHPDKGAEISADILQRLRCSKRTVAHVSTMIREHLRPVQLSDGVRPATDRAVFRYYRDVAPVAVDTIYLAFADYLAARGPLLEEADWDRHCRNLGDILARGFETPRESKPSLLLDGNQIQRLFDLPPGPEIGRLLRILRDAEAAGRVQTQEEAIDLLREAVREGGVPRRSSG
ncbi:MAG: HD domain-containing protein [Chloroflexi bacterium]|nr:HD domain-containing protein [Chloroflexota bacterium]